MSRDLAAAPTQEKPRLSMTGHFLSDDNPGRRSRGPQSIGRRSSGNWRNGMGHLLSSDDIVAFAFPLLCSMLVSVLFAIRSLGGPGVWCCVLVTRWWCWEALV